MRVRHVTRREALRGLPGLVVLAAGCARRGSGLPDFVDVVARVSPAVVAIRGSKETAGTGFAVAPDLIVTAAHVVKAAGATVQVVAGTTTRQATLLKEDGANDVALLKLDAPLTARPLGLSDLAARVGEWIVVVGNPFGAGVTATVGVVSAAVGSITATPQLAQQLQINAAVNPGNSGGPVCDTRGRVVGVATSFIPGGQGLAFVAPAATVQALLTTR